MDQNENFVILSSKITALHKIFEILQVDNHFNLLHLLTQLWNTARTTTQLLDLS